MLACSVTTITHFINTSLSSGTVPSKLKIAAVTPVLKKHGLEPSSLSSYRPISNLPFLSKTLEIVVASQLSVSLTAHNLYEPFQSGFRPLHSTETALVKVLNDLLLASDYGAHSTLLLLDLSSAFDTVCHEILISRLSAIGITGTALEWFSSYLTGRQQFVIYQNHRSSTKPISSGVPKGSVLGPLLFTIYMLPIGQIIKHHGFNFHCYADDIQICFSTHSTSVFPLPTLTNCIKELKLWLEANYLRFNYDKTEVILIGSKAVVSKILVN